MKVQQNGKLVRFSKWTDCWCTFSWNTATKPATLLDVSRVAVSEVIKAYTNHRKASSAEKNSD
jgi:hypothetical protein